jgi:hypothetical protein
MRKEKKRKDKIYKNRVGVDKKERTEPASKAERGKAKEWKAAITITIAIAIAMATALPLPVPTVH